jgi:hypothetical protein
MTLLQELLYGPEDPYLYGKPEKMTYSYVCECGKDREVEVEGELHEWDWQPEDFECPCGYTHEPTTLDLDDDYCGSFVE